MNLLAIDTATDICGVAMTDDSNLISEYRAVLKRAHAERLLGIIELVLKDARLSVHELDGIAVSIGPGSFTGLRIGLSVVKGLAFDPSIPVVAVNTLDAFAWQGRYYAGPICSWIKAQSDEAYSALYHMQHGNLQRTSEYQLIKLDEAADFIPDEALVFQYGMPALHEHLPEAKRITMAPSDGSIISALTVARLSVPKFQSGEVDDIDTLAPFYLKDFHAKKRHSLI
ncbi:tRNA (adenosine(37)-N6)-threonylcarbamoyltransferase complex dimerization subunit type 1 TsaB [candidate division KSB1 bacterium]|nr:tRNA (adenosine(37)-N6)-threonylcarbamoyltransferase complex dimerization subunit type 1 TsaB [candidate division KSB1 bacterium]